MYTQAASYNYDMVYNTARAISDEVRSKVRCYNNCNITSVGRIILDGQYTIYNFTYKILSQLIILQIVYDPIYM